MCEVLTNSLTGYGGGAITRNIQDGRRQPYLLTDLNQIRMGTSRSLTEHSGRVLKKSKEWS